MGARGNPEPEYKHRAVTGADIDSCKALKNDTMDEVRKHDPTIYSRRPDALYGIGVMIEGNCLEKKTRIQPATTKRH